jgi:hypothetical protein
MTDTPSVVIARNARAKASLRYTPQVGRSGDAKEQAQREITPSLDFSAAKHASQAGVGCIASANELNEIEPYTSILADILDLCRGCQCFFWLKIDFFKTFFSTGSGGAKNQKPASQFSH